MGAFSLEGQDWLGLGQTFGSLSQGTAECGSKPVCAFTASCRERQEAYNNCIARTSAVKSEMAEKSIEIQDRESKNKVFKYVIFAIIAIVALVLISKMIKRN